jgi:hypothetical protein
MTEWIEQTFVGKPVRVVAYNNLTATVAQEMNANFLLRGLRNTTDFEYENSISQVNRYLVKGETVFLITSPHWHPSVLRLFVTYTVMVPMLMNFCPTNWRNNLNKIKCLLSKWVFIEFCLEPLHATALRVFEDSCLYFHHKFTKVYLGIQFHFLRKR